MRGHRARRLPRLVGAALFLTMLGTAACGAAAHPAGTAGTSGAHSSAAAGAGTLKPTQLAALEIVRVQSVVPFSAAQLQQLIPMLQALQANPHQPAATLAQDAKNMEAVFSPLQNEALKNMGSNGSTGFPGTSGFPRFRSGTASGSAAGAFRRFRSNSGSGSSSGAGPRLSRTGPGGGAGFIYTLAIDTLQGKSPFPNAGRAGGPGTASASSAATA